jgi:carbamoyltransferase
VTVHVLGISAFYHDSAAALVSDGRIVAAAQEERFSRKRHDPRFPRAAINYCLQEAFIEPSELAAVVFYDNPVLSADRIVKSLLAYAPKSEEQWLAAAPSFLGVKPFVSRYVKEMLKTDVPLLFARHHQSHAASAFYPSPFERAAILTLDGVGEWATTSLATGEGTEISVLKEIHYPHSLGLLYSAFTYFCGFKVNSGEYKLMGLAPYGTPRYASVIRDKLIQVEADGSFRLNTDYFGFLDGTRMTSERFDELFGGPPRSPESRITRREMDLAASIQVVTEEVVLLIARHLREISGMRDLCMAGGVALNCVANGVLLREKTFDNLWIQPAAGDAGGALGGALLASHRRFGVPRAPRADGRDAQHGSYLGPSFSTAEIRAFLDRGGYPYDEMPDPTDRHAAVAGALARGKVVGFFSGRMEFGPRALGARSILGDARSAETQSVMNLRIKYRESFRPFAPSVLRERVGDYFELDAESPYMLLVAPVREDLRVPVPAMDSMSDDMLAIVNQARSTIPAVTHVDGSARIQTVDAEVHPDYHGLIQAFEELTGCAVIVNTSFNVRGEPIVCTPKDAYTCFMRTEMDVLVLEDFVLEKSAQPRSAEDDSWKQDYELD